MMFDGVPETGITASICAASSSPSEEGSQSKGSSIKIKFTEEEDLKLLELVKKYGSKDWIQISKLIQTRNPRQCRERWNNYVNPDLRSDPFSNEEDLILELKYKEYGPKWNKISKFFVNRSDNSIRNRWMMISRHRAKNTPIISKKEIHQKPMQIVKEIKVLEKQKPSNPFELFALQSNTYSIFPEIEQIDDIWGDFSFF